MDYIRSESDARSAVIEQLQNSNDQDLLYSNRVVAQKEVLYLKLEKELKQLRQDFHRQTEEMKIMSEDKVSLEDTINRLEETKEELVLSNTQLQEKLHALHRSRFDAATQYDPRDCPVLELTAEQKRTRAAVRIQALFRGWRTRNEQAQRLKNTKLLARRQKPVYHPHHTLKIPSIPRSFAHLLNKTDMLQRAHFPRTMARKQLLKWINRLYEEKKLADAAADKLVRPHKLFSDWIYSFYLTRHGTRESAEMDLVSATTEHIVM